MCALASAETERLERDARPFYGLVGAGGYGKEVMPLLVDQLTAQGILDRVRVAFVVDVPIEAATESGHDVVSLADFLSHPGPRFFNVAIGDSKARMRIADECQAAGATPVSIVSQHAVVQPGVSLGAGAIVNPFAAVSGNASIGRYFHANVHSYVAHDCSVGDFVTLAPGVLCNGHVSLGDHAYLGAGCTIKPTLSVGAGAIVGMGAVVTRDVPAGATVVGNPARPLLRT